MKKLFAFAMIATLAAPLYAADGATVFKTNGCAGCHGADGTKALPALGVKPLNSPEIKSQTEAQLVAAVTNGKNKMPAFGQKLSADDIKAVVAFVKGLK